MKINYSCDHKYNYHTADCPVGRKRLESLKTIKPEDDPKTVQTIECFVEVAGVRVGHIDKIFGDAFAYTLTGTVGLGSPTTVEGLALSQNLDGVFGVKNAYEGGFEGLF